MADPFDFLKTFEGKDVTEITAMALVQKWLNTDMFESLTEKGDMPTLVKIVFAECDADRPNVAAVVKEMVSQATELGKLASGAAQEADAIDKLRRNCAKALGLSQVPLAFGKDKTLVGGEMSHPSISPQNKTARNKTVRYEKLAGYTGTSPINLFNAFLNEQVNALSALEAEERGKIRTR